MINEVEITWNQLSTFRKDMYWIVDIRGGMDYQFGHVPDCIHIPEEQLDEEADALFKKAAQEKKKLIFMCKRGENSLEIVEEWMPKAKEAGVDIYSFQGGYNMWLVSKLSEQPEKADDDEESLQEKVEYSIRKTFHKSLFSKFAKAINQYELVKPGDRICVCISGGKDSMLMAKLFQELKRHNKFQFDLEFLVMDPGYSPANRAVIENNARLLGIPIKIFESDIFDSVYNVEKSPCYLCARMRRGHLYKEAQKLGCNKIALGHHYDDVIETILMGMLYGAQMQTMMPKLHSTNFEGMELIRPLYLIREADIIRFRDANGLQFIQCACKFTDTCTTCSDDGRTGSKRMEIKQLIADLKKKNPFVESNIFRSVENVSLNTLISYKKDGITHHFLDDYDQES